MNAAQIVHALANRYTVGDGWIGMAEVTPTGSKRRLDFLAISVFPSREPHIHGFEIKTARSDWLNEIKNPAKAESLRRFCTHYWLVAPKDIATKDELPAGWGWMQAREDGDAVALRRAVNAVHQPVDTEVVNHTFWRCMLLRQSQRQVRPQELADEFNRGVDTGMRRAGTENIVSLTERAERAEKREAELERMLTGAGYLGWNGLEHLRAAYRLVKKLSTNNHAPDFERLITHATKQLERVSEAQAAFAELQAAIDDTTNGKEPIDV